MNVNYGDRRRFDQNCRPVMNVNYTEIDADGAPVSVLQEERLECTAQPSRFVAGAEAIWGDGVGHE
jgi:hypothetical protein